MKKIISIAVILAILVGGVAFWWDGASTAIAQRSDPYVVRTFIDSNGQEIAEIVVPGLPPETYSDPDIYMTTSSVEVGVNILSDVPAFGWSYGCSATSAAMLFGYYDRTGYSNMYTGPTNGGVCPLDDSVWGITSYPSVTCHESPLSATHQGLDGRTTRGSVDDYWIDYGNAGPDPYIVNSWTEHIQGDCTGDFMGTNQSKYGLSDGATSFYYYTSGDPLYDFTGYEPLRRDGCHGMKLFATSRGYSVFTNFFQLIQGAGTDPNKGFTFADYVAEIDAGRPVIIQVRGHSMLGFGYNTTGNVVYLRNTWDFATHAMTWGGSYSGMQHYGVTVLRLVNVSPTQPATVTTNDATNVSTDSATLNMSYDFKSYNSGQVRFAYKQVSGNWIYTSWVNKSGSGFYSENISGLTPGTAYQFQACLNYSGTNVLGAIKGFTTAMIPIDHYTVSAINPLQTAGISFDVTIQAQDAGNNNITIGSEIINISFGKQDILATPTSAVTTNGTATVSMIMSKVQSGQSIIFTGATSHVTSISNTFDVNAGPIHHYSVSYVNSPQTVEVAFAVTIQAEDQYNNDINTYNETVNIGFSKTDEGASPVSTTTTNGTATINFVMTAPQTAQTIIFIGATSGVSGTSNMFTVVSGPVPTIPVLQSPSSASTITNLTPTVIWNASDGATSYIVQVSSSISFINPQVHQSVTNTFYDVPAATLGWSTIYYWRVNASNENGTSDWSNTWWFRTPSQPQAPASPILKSPIAGSLVSNLTPTLEWNTSTDATSYRIQVSSSSRFTSLLLDQAGITDTVYNIPSGILTWNKTYYWKVNASNDNGTSSWSSTWWFRTPSKPQPPRAPSLRSPSYRSVVSSLTPTLEWNTSTGATSYGVQVAVDRSFTGLVVNQTGITDTFYNVPIETLTCDRTYYWRANASNDNGTSSWSTTWWFRTPTPPAACAAPILESPISSSQVSGISPTLTWSASIGAASYQLQISTNYSFASLVVNQTGITDTIYNISSDILQWNKSYYWRVNASNENGTSNWSSIWWFKTPSQPQPPRASILKSPTNGSSVSSLSPTLMWSASTGATSYRLQVSTNRSFTGLVVDQEGITDNSYTIPSGILSPGTTYYWRVSASNSSGTSAWSGYRRFSTTSNAEGQGRQIYGQEDQGQLYYDAGQGSFYKNPPVME